MLVYPNLYRYHAGAARELTAGKAEDGECQGFDLVVTSGLAMLDLLLDKIRLSHE